MFSDKISDLSQNLVTPIGRSILNSINNQMQNGIKEFIIALDLDDTITKTSPEYGTRAIAVEYKNVAKEKYNIEFVIKDTILSIEDVRINMTESGLSKEQIKDIEKIASKKYSDFDRIIYAKKMNRKPSADIFFANFDQKQYTGQQKAGLDLP